MNYSWFLRIGINFDTDPILLVIYDCYNNMCLCFVQLESNAPLRLHALNGSSRTISIAHNPNAHENAHKA